MKSEDLPGTRLERMPAEFFDKLTPVDRANMTQLVVGLTEKFTDRGIHGALIGVGGVLTKPVLRKDIDYAVLFVRQTQALEKQYDVALQNFTSLTDAVKDMESSGDGWFHIAEVTEPRINHDFEELRLTIDDGDLQLQPADGTLIDLIPRSDESVEAFVTKQKEKFTVLCTF